MPQLEDPRRHARPFLHRELHSKVWIEEPSSKCQWSPNWLDRPTQHAVQSLALRYARWHFSSPQLLYAKQGDDPHNRSIARPVVKSMGTNVAKAWIVLRTTNGRHQRPLFGPPPVSLTAYLRRTPR